MMIMMIGFANYTFNELYSFGPVTANIFRKMVGFQKPSLAKMRKMTNHTYIVVITSSRIIIQTRVIFYFLFYGSNGTGAV